MKFRRKPVDVEAWKYTGENAQQLSRTLHTRIVAGRLPAGMAEVMEFGGVLLNVGDWIVRDERGCLGRMSGEAFAAFYEPVEEPS